VSGSYEHGHEPSGSKKGGESHDKLSDCHFFKDGSVTCRETWAWVTEAKGKKL